jgi:NitT/TauT family transport system ATP-binding protein
MLPKPELARVARPSCGRDESCAVRLRGVGHRYRTRAGGTYTALLDISLALHKGRFLAIVGPSGCGKSTLLNIVAGLLPPTAGEVEVFGEPLGGLNRRAAYMFQQDALLPWKTVLQNVMLGLIVRGVGRRTAEARAREWVKKVDLEGFADAFPYQLSGGMRKRAGMAQCWIVEPDIVLMDEPFTALDVHTRQRLETELLNLCSLSEQTVVFVTHDLEEAITLADKVAVLSAGPASRLLRIHDVKLRRPRDVMNLRTEPEFAALYADIWGDLRKEVLKSHEQSLTPVY